VEGWGSYSVRSTYTVQPYGLKIVYTDTVKEFHALRYHTEVSFKGTAGAFDGGKKVDGVIGVFDGRLMTLVHECVHAASALLQTCGIDPLSNTAEPLAYLVDHLVAVGRKRLALR
jgi:hypothetical protein